jgi:hypothetical protein
VFLNHEPGSGCGAFHREPEELAYVEVANTLMLVACQHVKKSRQKLPASTRTAKIRRIDVKLDLVISKIKDPQVEFRVTRDLVPADNKWALDSNCVTVNKS